MGGWNIITVSPSFNAEETMEEFVRLFAKARKEYPLMHKLVIVNDGSKDGTAKLVEKLKEEHQFIHLVDRKENKGNAFTMREGFDAALALARAEGLDPKKTIIMRMDSDLEHHPDWIRKICDPIVQGKNGYSVAQIKYPKSIGIPDFLFQRIYGMRQGLFVRKWFIQHASGMHAHRMDHFEKLHRKVKEEYIPKYRKAYANEEPRWGLDFVYVALEKKIANSPAVVRFPPFHIDTGRRPLSKILQQKKQLVRHFPVLKSMMKRKE